MSKSAFLRRVNEQLHKVIAEEVARLKDPGLGFVTITDVDTSPDLRNARVYYSVLGDAEERESTAAALARASTRIRAATGGRVRLKYLPKIDFEFDGSVDRGIRMDQLLRDLGGEHETDDRGTTPPSD
ncbi:MAG TPA: 30S ribosome-binding factor RbfA [Acidimicrobiia bacterium]|nr:30S ribosome-binding factor RbfA [Acidimicrobiia bacterium]